MLKCSITQFYIRIKNHYYNILLEKYSYQLEKKVIIKCFLTSKMLRAKSRKKIAEKTFCGATTAMENQDVDVNNIVITKLIKIKTDSKYLIGYLDKVIRLLVRTIEQ